MTKTIPLGMLTDEEIELEFNRGIQEVEAEALENGIPIARYDEEEKRGYLLFADGRRQYV